MLITLAEAHGIKMIYNEKDGEVTVERVEGLARRPEGESQPVKESDQAQQSFAQIQRTPNQPPNQSDIDYVRLANALKEHVETALQNAVENSPVHIQVAFDSSAHMVNNQTAMTLAQEGSIDQFLLSCINQGLDVFCFILYCLLTCGVCLTHHRNQTTSNVPIMVLMKQFGNN